MKSPVVVAIQIVVSLLVTTPAAAQVTRGDYDRAEGLRARNEALVTNVPESANWIGDTSRFWYRRSVSGGAEFVLVDATTGQKRSPFDHARLASVLSQSANGSWTAQTLPFTTFRLVDQEGGIEFQIDQVRWTCTLSDYRCAKGQPVGSDPPPGRCGVSTDPCEARTSHP